VKLIVQMPRMLLARLRSNCMDLLRLGPLGRWRVLHLAGTVGEAGANLLLVEFSDARFGDFVDKRPMIW
jgi:hypothetical protein